jgi:uncharacterized protein
VFNALWLAAVLALQLQIPSPTGFINDFAGVIDASARGVMTALIEQVRAGSGGEIVVVTLRDLGGRVSIDVARDIGRAWGVGAKGGAGDQARNAGVVVLLKPGDHPGDGKAEFAIASGSGAEGFVTDALAGRIRDAVGQESVRNGSYGSGLALGVAMLAQAYAQEYGFTLSPDARVPEPAPADDGRHVPRRFPWWLIIVVIFVLAGGGRRGGGGLMQGLFLASLLGGGRGGSGGWGGGGFGGGGFGGFGGGGGFSGGGASGSF